MGACGHHLRMEGDLGREGDGGSEYAWFGVRDPESGAPGFAGVAYV